MSGYQSRALSISVFTPLILGADQRFLFELTGYDHYSHTINAVGGWWEASFTIKDNQNRLEGWLADGLGRHIEVYNAAQGQVWQGFVNRVAIDLGNFSATIECKGYVHWLFYTYSSTTTGTQNLSAKITAILGQDPNSIFSTNYDKITVNTRPVKAYEQDNDLAWDLIKGLVAQGDASDNRYIFGIYENRQAVYEAVPTTVEYFQREGPLTIERGPLLDIANRARVVYSTVDTSTSPPTVGVRAATAVANDTDSQAAYGIIEQVLSVGGSTQSEAEQIRDTYLAEHKDPETSQEITISSNDPQTTIVGSSGARVYPWDIQAGKWLFVSDLLIGRTTETALRRDPRMVFIESITYSTPWGLRISGGKVDTLSQKLAKFGLAGVGA